MPPILVSKGGSSSRKAPTKTDLDVHAGRVIRTDPRLKGKADKATGVPKFLAQTLLKIIDKPREVVFNTLSGATGKELKSGYELADELGIGEGFLGKVGGFALDTALDPVTYLTAGTGGVGRAATKEAAAAALTKGAVKAGTLSEDIAKAAMGRVKETGSWASAAKESPIVREIAEKVFGTEAAAAAGKRQTLSMANKQFTKAELATLKEAGIKTGGIRFMGQTIVPAEKTAQLTAKVAERLAPSAAKVVGRVSPKLLADVGVLGHTFVKGMREAEDGRHAADEVLRGLANETAKVVDRKNPEAVQAFFDKIWRPGNPELWAGKLSPEAEAAAEKWSASFAHMLDEAQAAGVPIQKLQNWNGPRVLTPEAREALYGTEKLGATRVGATPGAAKHRTIADFDEAQALMADWLNLKPGQKFFSEDPFTALAQYGSVMNRTTHHTAAMKAFDEAGVRWGDLGKTGNDLKIQELKAAGFGKNSTKPVVEARRAIIDGVDDPRLAKLTPQTRALLKAEAELTQTKIAKQSLKVSAGVEAAGKRLGGIQNVKAQAEQAAEYWWNQVQTKAVKAQTRLDEIEALAAEGPLSKKLQTERAAIVRQFDTKNPHGVARKMNAAQERVVASQKREAEQEARVAMRAEAKSNLEAGLTASGKEWPGPNISRGEVPEGFQIVSSTGMGIFDQKAWPVQVAKELETNWKLGQPIFGQEWANFTGLFKKWVTIPFPGFHARNAIGGFFNNFLGDVRLSHYMLNEAIQKGELDPTELIPSLGMTAGEARQAMINHRVFSPVKGSSNQLADYIEGHVRGTGRLLAGRRGEPGWGVPGLQQASEAVETLGGRAVQEIEQRLRGAAFLKGLEVTKDPYAARMFTMARHGDYEELTSFERNVLKQFIPFYKWMRMNVPYQLQSVIENPGKVKMATGFWQNVVGDPEGQEQFLAGGGLIPPQVMASGAAFLGGNKTISADLPFYGINNYFTSAGWPSITGFAADLHPILRTAQEIVFKKRFYGGGEVGDIKDFSPVGGVYHGLGAALEKLPGGDALAVRTESGEIRLDSTLLSLLNVLPSSRVAALSRQLTDEGGAGKAALGLTTGLRLNVLDEKSQTIEGYRRQNILDEAVNELYARGETEQYKATAPSRKG